MPLKDASSFHELAPPDFCFYNLFPFIHYDDLLLIIAHTCGPWRRVIIEHMNTLHIYVNPDRFVYGLEHDREEKIDVGRGLFLFIKYATRFIKHNQMNIDHLTINGDVRSCMFSRFGLKQGQYNPGRFTTTSAMLRGEFRKRVGNYFVNEYSEPSFGACVPFDWLGESCITQTNIGDRPEIFIDLFEVLKSSLKTFVVPNMNTPEKYFMPSNFPNLTSLIFENVYLDPSFRDRIKFMTIFSDKINELNKRYITCSTENGYKQLEVINMGDCSKILESVANSDLKTLDVTLRGDMRYSNYSDFDSEKDFYRKLRKFQNLKALHLSIGVILSTYMLRNNITFGYTHEMPKISELIIDTSYLFQLGVDAFIKLFKHSLSTLSINNLSMKELNKIQDLISELPMLKHLKLVFICQRTNKDGFLSLLQQVAALSRACLESIVLEYVQEVDEAALVDFSSTINTNCSVIFNHMPEVSKETLLKLQRCGISYNTLKFHVSEIKLPEIDYNTTNIDSIINSRRKFVEATRELAIVCTCCNMNVKKHQQDLHVKLHHNDNELDHIFKLQRQLDLENYELLCPSCGVTVKRKDFYSHIDLDCPKNRIKMLSYDSHPVQPVFEKVNQDEWLLAKPKLAESFPRWRVN